ncbi:MAG TPA: hypothetical protein VIY73_26290 [Polyangiaceae bacterium]
MWTDVAIVEKDFADITSCTVPSSFRLGDDGELSLDGPLDVALVAGAASVTCRATIRWSLLGIAAPVALSAIRLRVRREIISTDEGRRVALSVRVEDLPLLDRSAATLVNHELESQRVALACDAAAAMLHEVVSARSRPPVVVLPAQPDVRHAA